MPLQGDKYTIILARYTKKRKERKIFQAVEDFFKIKELLARFVKNLYLHLPNLQMTPFMVNHIALFRKHPPAYRGFKRFFTCVSH